MSAEKKRAESTPYDADWTWFIRWMLITSVATGAAQWLRPWLGTLIGDTLPIWRAIAAIVSAAIIYGAQAYELPHPLRQERWRWLAYGVIGAAVGHLFSGPPSTFLIQAIPSSVPFNLSIRIALIIFLIQILPPALLHWTTLRHYASEAWVWFPALFAGTLFRGFFTDILMLNLGASLFIGLDLLTLTMLAALGTNAASGLVLWWLFHDERRSERIG